MLLLRFGAVDPLEPSATPVDDVLERATASGEAIGRIVNLLQDGAANRWLRERGLDLMACYEAPGPERSGSELPDFGLPDVIPIDAGRRSQPSLFSLPPVPPLEFVVGRHANPRKRDCVRIHHCPLELPDGFLLQVREELNLGPDVFIAHPAVCFAIAATRLRPAEVVEYGMGLCGSYALADEDTWRCAFDVPPLTRRDRLLANVRALARRWDERHFAANPKRPPGLTKCLEALDHVLDCSGSPLESKVATLLGLGERRGGYGFRGLTLNHRSVLSVAQRAVAGYRYPLVDGWFDGAHVGYEFKGDEFRGLLGKAKLERDRRLIEAGAKHGARILAITRDQLGDPELFDRFCQDLRKLLGIRERPITNWTRYRRDTLRLTLGLPLLNPRKNDADERIHPDQAA